MLALAGAVLVAAVVLAAGAPERLGIGSTQLEGSSGPDVLVVTEGRLPANSRVYRVALKVISAGIAADPAVEEVRQASSPGSARAAALEVELAPADEGERQAAVTRITENMDPGPLHVSIAGNTATLGAARDELGGDLWRLELLVLPLALVLLAATIGPRLLAAPVASAAFAIAGTLALLRILAGVADPSLLGAGAGAIVGLVLGIELPARLASRAREEAELAPGKPGLARALTHAAPTHAFTALVVSAGAGALLATPLPEAPSIALGCALAVVLAAVASLTVTPPLLALEQRPRTRTAEGGSAGVASDRGLPRALGSLAGLLGHTPLRAAITAAVALIACLALASPSIDARSRPFSAADLPASAAPRQASTALAGTRKHERSHGAGHSESDAHFDSDQSLPPQLPLAAALAAILLAAAFVARARTGRAVLLGLASLLPAAAGIGFAVLVYDHGTLAGLLGQAEQGPLDTGAIAIAAAALVTIAAARSAGAMDAVSEERSLDPGPAGVPERAAAQALPGAIAATLIGAAAIGALAGSGIYAARELGLAVAAGLVADLLLVRAPALVALAHWGEGGQGRVLRRRLPLGWRPWRARTQASLDETASET